MNGHEYGPFTGPRMDAGWSAICAHLEQHGSAGWVRLKETARRNSDLKDVTCGKMISEAVRHGLLEKHGRSYRLTEKGRAVVTPREPTLLGDVLADPEFDRDHMQRAAGDR